ncbi:MAG: PAS domain S-box protein [Deltaproteobacteria bacterium]|nr:PAS domain S-box protein [Deltaproteobacteria bacterium]
MPTVTRQPSDHSKIRSREILENAPIGFFEADLEGRILFANPALAKIHGYESVEAMVAAEIFSAVCADPGSWERLVDLLKLQGRVNDFECRHKKMDGTLFWTTVHACLDNYAGKDNAVVQAFCIDATDASGAAAKLEKFRWLVCPERTEKGLIAPSGQCPANPAYKTEFSGTGAIGRCLDPDLLRQMAGECVELLGTSIAVMEKDGTYVLKADISQWCSLLDTASRTNCMAESNAMAMNSGQWLCHECWMKTCTKAMRIREPEESDCPGGIRCYAVPILANDEVIGSIALGLGSPPLDSGSLKTLAWRYRIPDDRLHAAATIYDPRPTFLIESTKNRVLSVARLIGSMVERFRAEDALRQSEDLYRVLVANASQAILVIQNGFITFANAYAEKISGFTAEEISGHPIHRFVHPDDQERVFTNFIRRLSGESLEPYPFRFIARDGSVKWVETTGVVFQLQGKDASLIFLTDITRHKLTEKALAQATGSTTGI